MYVSNYTKPQEFIQMSCITSLPPPYFPFGCVKVTYAIKHVALNCLPDVKVTRRINRSHFI